MFKKLASEALGLSDIGRIIAPQDFDKVEADDYVLHEDGEKIYFLIKSKKDEYCFTNLALIHVDGDSAISAKRMLKRYDWYKYPIGGVLLETAGTIDLDVEIKFQIGDKGFSIDVDKKQIAQLADLYKALHAISKIQSSNANKREDALLSLDRAVHLLADTRPGSGGKSEELPKVTSYIHEWISGARDRYIRQDFGEIFEKYINN